MKTTRIDRPALLLDGEDAAILWQVARLNDVRLKARGRDENAYRVLLAVHEAAMSWRASVEGKNAVQSAETRQSSKWVTPGDLAQKLGVSSRTVRNDIAAGLLPAHKVNRLWVVTLSDARTYLAARHTH